MPVYVPPKRLSDSGIVTTFIFSDNGSEVRLWTLFGSSKTGIQIARMVTSFFLEPLDMMTTRHPIKVPVDWADGTSAAKWELIPGEFIDDSTRGHPYQTFIVWRKGDMWYHFYSTLGLDETLEFINALEEVKN